MAFMPLRFLLVSFDVAKNPHIAQNACYGFIVEFCAMRKVDMLNGWAGDA